jgi:hypothetical protein
MDEELQKLISEVLEDFFKAPPPIELEPPPKEETQE